MRTLVRRPIFRGWFVAAANMLIMFVSAGLVFYATAIYLVPLEQYFATSRTAISQGFALVSVVGAFLMPVAGVVVDRWGPRRSIAIGSAGMVLILALLSRMTALWHFYVLVVLLGVAFPFAGPVPNQLTIGRWFSCRRGRAMGVMMAGTGLGGLMLPFLIGTIIEGAGWRSAFLLSAALFAAIAFPAVHFLLRDRPEEVGLLPDGAQTTEELCHSSSVAGATLGQGVRSQPFVLITAAGILTFAILGLISLHVPAILQGVGMSLAQAGALQGLVLGTSAIGRLALGGVIDRLNERVVWAGSIILMGAGALLMFLPESTAARGAYVLTFGLGLGGATTALPLLTQAVFGNRHVGRIYGFIAMATSLAIAAGNYLGGRLYDLQGSYGLALILAGIAGVVGAILLLMVRPVTWPDEA